MAQAKEGKFKTRKKEWTTTLPLIASPDVDEQKKRQLREKTKPKETAVQYGICPKCGQETPGQNIRVWGQCGRCRYKEERQRKDWE